MVLCHPFAHAVIHFHEFINMVRTTTSEVNAKDLPTMFVRLQIPRIPSAQPTQEQLPLSPPRRSTTSPAGRPRPLTLTQRFLPQRAPRSWRQRGREQCSQRTTFFQRHRRQNRRKPLPISRRLRHYPSARWPRCPQDPRR